MHQSRFVYVTYIRTTQERLWDALRLPEFTRQYWYGVWQDCDWREGSAWTLMFEDGRVGDVGRVLEIDPPRRLVLQWRNEFRPELKAEGHSRATFDLETVGETVKLTVVHEMDVPQSQFIDAVSNGWPSVLSSLKSLLETGHRLDIPLPRPPAEA